MVTSTTLAAFPIGTHTRRIMTGNTHRAAVLEHGSAKRMDQQTQTTHGTTPTNVTLHNKYGRLNSQLLFVGRRYKGGINGWNLGTSFPGGRSWNERGKRSGGWRRRSIKDFRWVKHGRTERITFVKGPQLIVFMRLRRRHAQLRYPVGRLQEGGGKPGLLTTKQ